MKFVCSVSAESEATSTMSLVFGTWTASNVSMSVHPSWGEWVAGGEYVGVLPESSSSRTTKKGTGPAVWHEEEGHETKEDLRDSDTWMEPGGPATEFEHADRVSRKAG